MSLSESEFTEIRDRMAANVGGPRSLKDRGLVVGEFRVPFTVVPAATGRLPKPKMNRNESEYDAHLQRLYLTGEIQWRGFEAITIKLGPDCRLTPDFLVMYPNGKLELHDCKGRTKIKLGKKAGGTKFYAEEDALVKARVVAGNFVIPIYFLHREKNGEWTKTPIGEKA